MAMGLQDCDAQLAERVARDRPHGRQRFGVFLAAQCYLQFLEHDHMKP